MESDLFRSLPLEVPASPGACAAQVGGASRSQIAIGRLVAGNSEVSTTVVPYSYEYTRYSKDRLEYKVLLDRSQF